MNTNNYLKQFKKFVKEHTETTSDPDSKKLNRLIVKDAAYYLNFVSNSPLCYNSSKYEENKEAAKENEAISSISILLSPETIEKYLRMMILNSSDVPIKPVKCDNVTVATTVAKYFEEAVDAYMPEFEVHVVNLSAFFSYFAGRAGTKIAVKGAVKRAENEERRKEQQEQEQEQQEQEQQEQEQQAWKTAADWLEKLSKNKARMRELIVSECSGESR